MNGWGTLEPRESKLVPPFHKTGVLDSDIRGNNSMPDRMRSLGRSCDRGTGDHSKVGRRVGIRTPQVVKVACTTEARSKSRTFSTGESVESLAGWEAP